MKLSPLLDYIAPLGLMQMAMDSMTHMKAPDGSGITPVNSDGDPYPDFRDFDSDNDGIKDKVEAQDTYFLSGI